MKTSLPSAALLPYSGGFAVSPSTPSPSIGARYRAGRRRRSRAGFARLHGDRAHPQLAIRADLYSCRRVRRARYWARVLFPSPEREPSIGRLAQVAALERRLPRRAAQPAWWALLSGWTAASSVAPRRGSKEPINTTPGCRQFRSGCPSAAPVGDPMADGRRSLSLARRDADRLHSDGAFARRSGWRACPSPIWPGRKFRHRSS